RADDDAEKRDRKEQRHAIGEYFPYRTPLEPAEHNGLDPAVRIDQRRVDAAILVVLGMRKVQRLAFGLELGHHFFGQVTQRQRLARAREHVEVAAALTIV